MPAQHSRQCAGTNKQQRLEVPYSGVGAALSAYLTTHTWGYAYSVEVLLGFQSLPEDGRSLATEFTLYSNRYTLYIISETGINTQHKDKIKINYLSQFITCSYRFFWQGNCLKLQHATSQNYHLSHHLPSPKTLFHLKDCAFYLLLLWKL